MGRFPTCHDSAPESRATSTSNTILRNGTFNGLVPLYIFAQISQGGADPLFQDRVVEGHFQDIVDSHTSLDGPGQKVGEMLDLGAEKFRTENRREPAPEECSKISAWIRTPASSPPIFR